MLLKNQKEGTRYVSAQLNPSFKAHMSTQLDQPSFDHSSFNTHLPQMYRSMLKDFRKTIQSSFRLHVLFVLFLAMQIAFFIPFGMKSTVAAATLGGVFLTVFSYIILLLYDQAKKPQQMLALREQFLQSCRHHISIPEGEPQHHLSIAEALAKLAAYLHDFESSFYRPSLAHIFSPSLNWLSCFFYRKDVFKMKELLLQAAIEEHVKQVRTTPTDLEVHASLANTYVSLSRLYQEHAAKWDKKERSLADAALKASQLAVEELQILNYYAPNDPWVHEQLALGYKLLNMPEKELFELETLAHLRPQDLEILHRLGVLYFQKGMNAKGLQTYQTLRQLNFKKAEDLISHYGSN